ncbi:hypothetical protein GH714_019637 [Hevea brasiliensis]|uniref:Peroxisomal membrane protein PEX16 n=1 Tax=Hevea brasiliensis TaxID=3981 RepID=A0A6A6MGK3_HEVBR|nr:hypothetical protein GH714_019637 [Hevea brasiliensis]
MHKSMPSIYYFYCLDLPAAGSRNGLTWLLRERFSASEIGPEAVTAILGIITAINEHIIDTTPTQWHAGSVEPYSFPYSLCISAIKDLETLVEVTAQHYYGEDKKWNFIAVTEALTVLVRLALFRNSGYKMLLHGGETPNIEKHSDFSSQQTVGGFLKPGNHGPSHLRGNNGRNPWNPEGRALSALSRFGQNARMVSDPVWLRRVQHQHAIMEPPSPMVDRTTLSTILSEKGVDLMFELVKKKKIAMGTLRYERPFFSKNTRQRLESSEKLLEPIPIIGVLTAKIVELVIGAQTRYTYMSGS